MFDADSETVVYEFAPPRRYIVFLWSVLAWVQAGLFFLWSIPWYRREVMDPRSWAVWAVFDLILLAGAVHATMLRVRVDARGFEFLKWNFRWTRWDWDEITRLESRPSLLGARYQMRSLRGRYGFASMALRGAGRLAAMVVERADLDDYGEEARSMQMGAVHVWLHPSASEVE